MSENRTSNSLKLKLPRPPRDSSEDPEVLEVHRVAAARLKATNADASSYLDTMKKRVAASRTAILQEKENSKQVLDDMRRRNDDELADLSNALNETLKSLAAEPVVDANQVAAISGSSGQLRAAVAQIRSEFESSFRDFMAGFHAERSRALNTCQRLCEPADAETQMRNRAALLEDTGGRQAEARVEIEQWPTETAQTSWAWLLIVYALLFAIGFITKRK
jgi:hypothetical protein